MITDSCAITFYFPDTETVRILTLSISGNEEAFEFMSALHERTGWSAADEVLIDFDEDSTSGLQYWRGTLDVIREHAGLMVNERSGTNKHWWQFWK
ncbi:hypothetical protein [Paenibacillus glycinis]|uniref:Uncharacterized protein n=1 Tax=Paenibacillus glycinis TaxID=2697035 RepID=A0ABW9XN21_9BACL|nr:hypothetical protein [Paenibacillus glycinis]NBD23804.1 hypothetical protein [Paenibacillus glycinis]